MWCQRKSLKCFCSHNSRREVRREQTPFVDHNKGLTKLPTWSFQDMPSLKILKKSIRRKRTLDFFLWSADEIYDVLYLRIGDTRAILWEKKYQHKRTRTLLVCWRYLVHNTKKSCLFFCNYLQGNEQKGLFIIRC